MQKILMILLVFGITNSYAQSRGEPTKSLTVAEANKLNGVANPTINGIPYSQYKAQQDALKNQQIKPDAVQTTGIVTINANDARPAQAKPQAPVSKFENDGYSEAPAPVVTKQVVNETSPPRQQAIKLKEPVKIVTPAAAVRGASADPAAIPNRPATKTPEVQVPEKNSGNTKPEETMRQGG